jgi:hypothetical protein
MGIKVSLSLSTIMNSVVSLVARRRRDYWRNGEPPDKDNPWSGHHESYLFADVKNRIGHALISLTFTSSK